MARAKKAEVVSIGPFEFTDVELLDLRDRCLAGADRRKVFYDELRRHVFDNTIKNSLSKYLNDIVSLIYLPDNIIFDIKVPSEVAVTAQQTDKMQKLCNSLPLYPTWFR